MTNIKLLVNPNSGNGFGKKILQQDLHIEKQATQPHNIKVQLQKFLCTGDTLIIAGGDGTFHLIFNALYQCGLLNKIKVALFPLGTGNDLSNALKLSKTTLPNLIKKISTHNTYTTLPLWKFNDTVLCNYVSWGMDAKIVHDVDTWRKRFPNNRFFNKLLYVVSAFYNFFSFKKSYYHLESSNEKLLTLIVANVNSYAAGCTLGLDSILSEQRCYLVKIKNRFDFIKFGLKRLIKAISLHPQLCEQLNVSTNTKWIQIDGEASHNTSGTVNYIGECQIFTD